MAKRLLPHLFLLALAMFITFTTAYRRVEVSSKEDLRELTCGWPLPFAVSDQSWRDPPYPWKASCMDGEWGDPIALLLPQFVINVAAFYVLGVALHSGYRAVRKRQGMGRIAGQI